MKLNGRLKRWLVRVRQKVPPGLRSVIGLLLVAGGLVGFLPILGFWMIPLGILVIALDVKPLVRNIREWRRRRQKR